MIAVRPRCLFVFDLLGLDGKDPRTMTLSERRQALHRHVKSSHRIKSIEHVETHGEALFRAISEGDHEGIVAKRLDGPYRAGRQGTRIKIKNRNYSRRGGCGVARLGPLSFAVSTRKWQE